MKLKTLTESIEEKELNTGRKFKVLFKNQDINSKNSTYNLKRETKDILFLEKENERYGLKINKKSYRTYIYDTQNKNISNGETATPIIVEEIFT